MRISRPFLLPSWRIVPSYQPHLEIKRPHLRWWLISQSIWKAKFYLIPAGPMVTRFKAWDALESYYQIWNWFDPRRRDTFSLRIYYEQISILRNMGSYRSVSVIPVKKDNSGGKIIVLTTFYTYTRWKISSLPSNQLADFEWTVTLRNTIIT